VTKELRWYMVGLFIFMSGMSIISYLEYSMKRAIGIEAVKAGLVQDWRGNWVKP